MSSTTSVRPPAAVWPAHKLRQSYAYLQSGRSSSHSRGWSAPFLGISGRRLAATASHPDLWWSHWTHAWAHRRAGPRCRRGARLHAHGPPTTPHMSPRMTRRAVALESGQRRLAHAHAVGPADDRLDERLDQRGLPEPGRARPAAVRRASAGARPFETYARRSSVNDVTVHQVLPAVIGNVKNAGFRLEPLPVCIGLNDPSVRTSAVSAVRETLSPRHSPGTPSFRRPARPTAAGPAPEWCYRLTRTLDRLRRAPFADFSDLRRRAHM
jgi:hypothetical protein